MLRKLFPVFLSFAAFAQQPDYFPLQVGNQWIYRSSRVFNTAYTVEVRETRTVDGQEYFVLAGLPGAPLLVRKNDAGTLVAYDEREKRERNWVAFGAATGDAFRTEIDPCNNVAVIANRQAPLRSPLGDFNNALEVRYTPAQCADAGLISESYLPFVGLAERRMSNIAGEVALQLIYARIGGFTVLSEQELTFGVTLNASRYKAGERITTRMTFRNTQPEPVRATFPSGQDFDIVIRNDKGEEVYRWSKGRAFTLIFRQLSLSGERNWVEVFPVPDLAPGSYTLTANLATSPERFEASVPLTILP